MITVAITGASLMVGLDFLMEQLASRFDFWHFAGGIADLQNYVAWFFVALFLQFLCYKMVPKHNSSFSMHLYLNQVAFFLVSYIILVLI
jgi:putative membrane protein